MKSINATSFKRLKDDFKLIHWFKLDLEKGQYNLCFLEFFSVKINKSQHVVSIQFLHFWTKILHYFNHLKSLIT